MTHEHTDTRFMLAVSNIERGNNGDGIFVIMTSFLFCLLFFIISLCDLFLLYFKWKICQFGCLHSAVTNHILKKLLVLRAENLTRNW